MTTVIKMNVIKTIATYVLASGLFAVSVGLFALGGGIQWSPQGETFAVATNTAPDTAN